MGLAAAFERRDTEADETNQWVKLSTHFKMISCNAKQDAARLRFLKMAFQNLPEPSRIFQDLWCEWLLRCPDIKVVLTVARLVSRALSCAFVGEIW